MPLFEGSAIQSMFSSLAPLPKWKRSAYLIFTCCAQRDATVTKHTMQATQFHVTMDCTMHFSPPS